MATFTGTRHLAKVAFGKIRIGEAYQKKKDRLLSFRDKTNPTPRERKVNPASRVSFT